MANAKKKRSKKLSAKAIAAKRSAAAIKGWETRRKNDEFAEVRKEIERAKKRPKAGSKKKSKKVTRGTRKARDQHNARIRSHRKLKKLERDIAKLRSENKGLKSAKKQQSDEAKLRKLVSKWPSLVPREQINENGTIALHPSRLRTHPDREEILKGLENAKRHAGGSYFTQYVDYIADYYDVEVQEVYSLFESP